MRQSLHLIEGCWARVYSERHQKNDEILEFERRENSAIREAFQHRKLMLDLIGFARILELEVPWTENVVGAALCCKEETLMLTDT